ncbi:MAG: septum formation initiator [Porphyromonas sp.]|nr:septum formation initiator [Porphyromonas sp.]
MLLFIKDKLLRPLGRKLREFNRRFWFLKYLATAAFILGVAFFTGDRTLPAYLRLEERDSYISAEIKREAEMFQRDSTRVSELKELGLGVEEIARERYHMHAPGEEVFIIKRPDSMANEQKN